MDTTTEIQELGRRWAEAEQHGDVAELEALAAEDFTLVGPLGFVLDRQQWVDRYRTGDLVTRSLVWDEVTVHDHGHVAVAVGRHTQRAEHKGRPANGSFRATHVWVRAGEQWRLAGIHLSTIMGQRLTPELNHTIVRATDKAASAEFLAGILGVAVGDPVGPFVPVQLANGVTLDFMDVPDVPIQHYAFLVSEPEFDRAFALIRENGVEYYADPEHRRPGETNTMNGGRGVYFVDPDGHNMELLTRA